MTDVSQPRVSVVTPFYNGAEYLRACLDSVLRQTYGNFEYLLIDNHSRDGASEIAREYAARDARIRVIVPPSFLPQVDNYNFALTQCAPDSGFIKMVAADDWLFPECLREMVALASESPRVAVVSSYRLRGSVVDARDFEPEQPVMSGRDACRLHLLKGVFLFGSPTTVMYRADVVRERNPFFVPDRLHPDTEAIFEILAKNDFGFVPQILSFSRTQLESEMGSRRAFGPEALDRFLMVAQYGPLYLDEHEQGPELSKARRWHYSTMAQGWLAQRLGPKSEDFWRYHQRGLQSVGLRLQPELLASAVARVLVRGLLSPLGSARSLVQAVAEARAVREG